MLLIKIFSIFAIIVYLVKIVSWGISSFRLFFQNRTDLLPKGISKWTYLFGIFEHSIIMTVLIYAMLFSFKLI